MQENLAEAFNNYVEFKYKNLCVQYDGIDFFFQ